MNQTGKRFLHFASYFWATTNFITRRISRGNAKKLPVPVISVGNLVAGGVGKTEVVSMVASHFIKNGLKVIVAMRGYGSPLESSGFVTNRYESQTMKDLPDEAIVHLIKCPGVWVAIGKDRYGQCLKALELSKADLVILDDGFQHFSIERDLDIIVQNSDLDFPPLRDFSVELDLASAVLEFGSLRSNTNDPKVFLSRYEVASVSDVQGNPAQLPERAIGLCGIGNPARFKKFLHEQGVELEQFHTFSDHHNFRATELKPIIDYARNHNLKILTTLKDIVKIERFASELKLDYFRYVGIKVAMPRAEGFWQIIDRVVKY